MANDHWKFLLLTAVLSLLFLSSAYFFTAGFTSGVKEHFSTFENGMTKSVGIVECPREADLERLLSVVEYGPGGNVLNEEVFGEPRQGIGKACWWRHENLIGVYLCGVIFSMVWFFGGVFIYVKPLAEFFERIS